MAARRWRLTRVDERTREQLSTLQCGELCYCPEASETEPRESWSADYRARHRRPPIFVKMPGSRLFCIDQRAYDHVKGGWYGKGWNVTGREPEITVKPSINLVGSYHGFIRAGWITDDVEGRQFTDAGQSLSA